jgi:hypothetical protein
MEASDGRVRWVAQLISADVPDFRIYVQFNGEKDIQMERGSLALVGNGVVVAGGVTPRTDGGLDDTLYVIAQTLVVIPPLSNEVGDKVR